MPGVYDDDIVVHLTKRVDRDGSIGRERDRDHHTSISLIPHPSSSTTAESEKNSRVNEINEETVRIPIKWTVTGCPMVIDQNTLGMSIAREKNSPRDNDNNDDGRA